MKLSVFFPFYNEELNIKRVVTGASEVLEQIEPDYEIIIVNDGSKDKTEEIANDLAERNKKIRVISHHPNRGYGGALKSGFYGATGDYIFFTDGDGQLDFSQFPLFWERRKEADLILGYRTNRMETDGWKRVLNAKLWNVLNRIMFGLKIRDIDCAFKLVNKKVIDTIPKMQSEGAMFSAELLIKAKDAGFKFLELPVVHLVSPEKLGGTTGAKPKVIIRAFKELFRFRLNYRVFPQNQKSMTKIAVIGGGPLGLYTAYKLSKKGHKVSLFEKSDDVGGLAGSFSYADFALEKFYHHIFSTDKKAVSLINELGLSEKLDFQGQNTANYVGGKFYPFSTPHDILKYSRLSLIDRVRFGMATAFLKFLPVSLGIFLFSKNTAFGMTPKIYGKKAFDEIWKPLLSGKFGPYCEEISMVWLWGRIRLRSSRLGYLVGGFQALFDALARDIAKNDGVVHLGEEVLNMSYESNWKIKTIKDVYDFEKIVFTGSSQTLLSLLKEEEKNKVSEVDYIGARAMVLILKEKISDYYWVNLNDKDSPFLALVEHTNFRPVEEYAGKHIVYLGNYLETNGEEFESLNEEVIKKAFSYLKKIKPDFSEKDVEKALVFKEKFAQPIVGVGYEKKLPKIDLGKGLYFASMEHIWPWDRGIEQAFNLGDKLLSYL